MKSSILQKTVFDLCLVLSVIAFVIIFAKPELCYDAVAHGMEMSAGFLVPTLFLSTTFTAMIYSFLSAGGIFPEKYSIMILGIIGGYPTCSYLTESAYISGKISKKDALALTYSITCAGPAFIVGAISSKFLHNPKLGIIMYISVIIPQIILFLLLKDKTPNVKSFCNDSVADIMCDSVSGATRSSLYLTGYVALFSALCTILKNISSFKLDFVIHFLEITFAVEDLTSFKPPYYILRIVFFVALGDFCVHLQVKHNLKELKYSYLLYLASRIGCALLSVGIFSVIIKFIPIDLSVISFDIMPVYANIPASVFLILLALYTVSVKNKGLGHS